MSSMTSFLDSASSAGVSASALPMTGMTLTRGERRVINSMSTPRGRQPLATLGGGGRTNAPMPGGRDKVEQDVHAVVSEARVTLDARLLGQDVVVLALQVADDLGEAVWVSQAKQAKAKANLASLSIWSPKPGVS